jgi:hypothetical protein
MGINNMDPYASAIAFLTRGFWSKGSAISLAAGNPTWTAGMVAQNTQGSAFPERYDLVRAQALQFFKGKGGGGGGGIVGAIGGALGDLFSKGAGFIIDQLPGIGDLPGWLHGTGKFVLDKVTEWIKDKVKGLVGGGGGGPLPKGVSGNIQAAIALSRQIGNWTFGPGQLFRPGGTTHHGTGRAADFGDAGKTRKQMVSLYNLFKQTYGSKILELFYDPMGEHIKNGQRIGRPFGGHGDHVHIALAKGGIFGGPFVGSYAAGGTVPRDGFAQVHAGETITPAGESGPLMHVETLNVFEPMDFERELRKLAWAVETA